MNNNEIIMKIEEVFKDFFDDDIVISAETTIEDIEDWDSVAHIQLIFELEEMFDIQFDVDEIPGMTSIQAIIEQVEKSI